MKAIISRFLMSGIFIFTVLSYFNAPVYGQDLDSPVTIGGNKSFIKDLALSENGSTLFYTLGSSIIAYDMVKKENICTFTIPGSRDLQSIAFAKDSSLIAGGTEDGEIIIWDAKSRLIVNRKKMHTGAVLTLEISPSSENIFSGGADGSVLRYKTATNTYDTLFSNKESFITRLTLNSSGHELYFSDSNGRINSFNLLTNKTESFSSINSGIIRDMLIENSSGNILAGGKNKKIISINPANNSSKILYSSVSTISSFDTSEEDNILVMGHQNGSIILFKPQGNLICKVMTGVPIQRIKIIMEESNKPVIVAATFGKGVKVIPFKAFKCKAG